MKGRDTFTHAEAGEIRELLRQLRRSGRDAQKRIRGKLRKTYGFRITCFRQDQQGFTVSDFDELIERGRITIAPEGTP